MDTGSRKRLVRTGYVATAWWSLFAVCSFYWAAGGTLGLSTLGDGIESHAVDGETWFTALVAITGVFKLVPVVFVLSLIRPWGERLPMKVRLVVAGGFGLGAILYGGVNMSIKLVALLGFISHEEVGSRGFWGHLLIWDPVFIAGGLLLCTTVWLHHRSQPR